MPHLLKKEVLKMQKPNILANPNNFGTKIFVMELKNSIPKLDVFRSQILKKVIGN